MRFPPLLLLLPVMFLAGCASTQSTYEARMKELDAALADGSLDQDRYQVLANEAFAARGQDNAAMSAKMKEIRSTQSATHQEEMQGRAVLSVPPVAGPNP